MANFLKKLNKTGQETVQMVNDTTEISKINALIQQCKSEKEQIYTQLGKLFYDMSIEEQSIDIVQEPFASLFGFIKNYNENIEKFKAEIIRIKNIKLCFKCGRECSSDSVFCAGCGAKLIQEDNPLANNRCCKCGTELMDDDVFCFNCDNKVTK